MRVDCAAIEPHYLDHLCPIFLALPEHVRGEFYVARELLPHAAHLGVYANARRMVTGRPIVVASEADMAQPPRRTKLDAAKQGPVIFVEHGVGQTYSDNPLNPAHPGGMGRDSVALFLDTNQRCQDLNLAAYPGARSVIIGAPKLDRWWNTAPAPSDEPPLVVASFHWAAPTSVEAHGAFDFYRDAIVRAHAHGQRSGRYRLAVHCHPRTRRIVAKWCELHAIPFMLDFSDVLAEAHAYVVDTSSTLWEFAATGRPVGALNCSMYRRDVHHGLRWWDAVPGPQLDEPDDLDAFLEQVLADVDPWPRHRQAVLDEVYPVQQGAAAVAAAAIVDWLTERAAPQPAPVRRTQSKVARVAYVGNFDPEWSTENDCRLALESLGCEVLALQENRTTPGQLRDAALASDLLLWTTTWDDAQPATTTADLVEELLARGIPSAAYHLDVFFGTDRRGRPWWRNPAFHLQHQFTADGDHVDEWAKLRPEAWQETHWLPAGVRHTVAPPFDPSPLDVCDVAFVGADGVATPYHPEWPYRTELVAALRSMCNYNGWTFRNPGGVDPKIPRERMGSFYASAKVTIGDSLCVAREPSRYWSDRVYEATGRAGLLVMPEILALNARDQFGGILPTYPWGHFAAMEALICDLLVDDAWRAEVREACHAVTAEGHTYRHRMATLLDTVGIDL